MHMGAAVIEHTKYLLVMDGLVPHPLALTLVDLNRIPQIPYHRVLRVLQ